jgi:hypothetical protein
VSLLAAKKVEVIIIIIIMTYLLVDICPQLLVDRGVLNPDFRILIKYCWIFL